MPAGSLIKSNFGSNDNLKSAAAEGKGEHEDGGKDPEEEQGLNVKQQVKERFWLKNSVAE